MRNLPRTIATLLRSLTLAVQNRLVLFVLVAAAAFAAESNSSVAEAVMRQDQAALRAGNPDAITALLGHDAAVNAKDGLAQETALMWAVRGNHAAAVQALLEHGAEVNGRTRTGKAPAPRLPGAGGGPGNGSHGTG